MENSKQIQKAGNDSQQIQAKTVIFNNGITEERTREIFLRCLNSKGSIIRKKPFR